MSIIAYFINQSGAEISQREMFDAVTDGRCGCFGTVLSELCLPTPPPALSLTSITSTLPPPQTSRPFTPEGSNLKPLRLPARALDVELKTFFCGSLSQVAVTLQFFPNR